MEENNFINFGDYLISVRKEKNLTLEVISDDIKISIKYLKALEDSNVEIFPNEVLAVGFLRTYSEYLDIDFNLMSSLFKDYKRRLNNSYIGIKVEDKSSDPRFCLWGSGGKKKVSKNLSLFNIESFNTVKVLLGIISIIVLIFVILTFKKIENTFSKIFQLQLPDKEVLNVHKVSFNEKFFWNVSLKEGDFLFLIYGDNISKYKVSFINDNLVIISGGESERENKNVFNLGELKEIDFDDNMKVKMIYETYSYDKLKLKVAHVSLESFLLNIKYVVETSIDNRFNILDWQFDVKGPKKLSSNSYFTLYSSQKLSSVDLKVDFLNDTFFRYADENNLYGKSIVASKGTFINLLFDRSLILFFSRLSDANVFLNDRNITSFLKEQGKEILAIQFFWLKTPSGFDLKFSEVY